MILSLCCHNEHDGVSNHQPHDCLLNRLFRCRSKKTSKLRVIGLCEGNSPVTGKFPAQRDSNVENVTMWWRHHDSIVCDYIFNVMESWHGNVSRIVGALWGKSICDRCILLSKCRWCRPVTLKLILHEYKDGVHGFCTKATDEPVVKKYRNNCK